MTRPSGIFDFYTLAELSALDHSPEFLEPTASLTRERWNVAQGMRDDRRHFQVSKKAAEVISGHLFVAPFLEHAFACRYDLTTGQVLNATWLITGTENEVRIPDADLRCGELFIHNHPDPLQQMPGSGLRPSIADIDTASKFACRGIGSAIVSNDLSQFLLLRPPGKPTRSDTTRSASFRLDRLGVTFHCGMTRSTKL